ncbi:glycosyltransferase family 4 protein [Paraburkholderia caballeronis]|uniref:glycosyltransferase family 4 protein n=1 Tax=Paraburkholderia caballeronis TaxID=416943 RepID=UPI001064CE39|nr:glycosyltransferase family 4 protein [Paraburkholderia caballeronis]TDV15575.1 glycosyltransferase involved in cell wall biosynthesis [Paraburkholderia caballeronis]TDV17830.1 glycosyltransferase involved in cell wall biosynthesis [Paraburkholderia caballeronis]TDV26556.1 glycosyltransferase involved in cell wall biosynthesis [Paraburkholderia caballeronis]
MRILQLILAPRLSGAEMLVKGLAIDHQRSGHAVCVTSLLPAQDDFAAATDELAESRVLCHFPARRYERVGRLLFLYRSIRRFNPDVVFAHATIPAMYARALPVRVPIVWVMHSSVNDFVVSPLLCRAEQILSRRAKAVIGVSQKHVDDYRDAIGRHPPLIVVPNGIDVARFRKGAAASRDMADTGAGPSKQIVQIGRYVPEKGQLETLRAFTRVLEAEPDARLLLCGVIEDRAYHAAVVALANELGIAPRVDIVGPMTRVDEILDESGVFVMPSSNEAQGIAFLEALASGIPVVASLAPAFAFARGWPGVQLVDTSDPACYGRALVAALREPRSHRPLDGFRLQDTAERYLAIARQAIG